MLKAFLFHVQRCFWYFWGYKHPINVSEMIAEMIWTWKMIYTEQHLPWEILSLLLVQYALCGWVFNTPDLSRQSWQESLRRYSIFLRKKYFISYLHSLDRNSEICIFFHVDEIQWILCSEWVPSEWESKQLLKTSQ